MNFPKNIFQIWFVIKNPEMPDKWKEAQQTVISMNPDWNYKLVDEDYSKNIVKTYFPDFYQYYISFPYTIQRIDAIRYCLLYLYGGIYLDLDYICNKSFGDITLTAEVGLIKSNNTPGVFTNSFLASKPKSEFWLMVIEQMKKPLNFFQKITKHLKIMNSTGPFMINNVANKNKKYIETLENIQTPCNVCNINQCKTGGGYYITPIDGSLWHSWDSALLNVLFCNKVIILVILILIFILILKKNKRKQ
jgi:mannosyltransferase OCH1-like enzyme